MAARRCRITSYNVCYTKLLRTSQAGAAGPAVGKDVPPLKDARSLDELKAMEVIISCQGGEYTSEIYPQLRAAGWDGYWIDAASTLRMVDSSVIVLDPVNDGSYNFV